MHGCLLALVSSSLPSLLGCEASFATAGAALEPKSLAVEAPEEDKQDKHIHDGPTPLKSGIRMNPNKINEGHAVEMQNA
jgi:hypothetical protein